MPLFDYKKLIHRKRKEYQKYMTVFSPALKTFVVFNAKGFNHLRFTVDRKARSLSEQIYKLGLMQFVREVISKAKMYVDYRRNSIPSGFVEYWSLVAFVGKIKVKVIVKRDNGKGKFYFWSLMKAK